MPEQQPLTSQLTIKLAGQPVQQLVMAAVAEVTVDQHTHLPHMFTIRLHDPGMELLDSGPFDLTKEIEIAAEDAEGQRFTLMTGEITALEPRFEEGMVAELLVRGYDKSHRLYRETKSRAFLNKKDSDLAADIAQAAGLQPDVDATATVYDHIYQHNQSDLEFLMERAWRIGYECYVADGKLAFKRPSDGRARVTLTWGEDLLSFRPRMTLAEQVNEVMVKGWDPDKQQAIVGQARNGRLYPQVGDGKDGAAWANGFGAGKLVIVDQPVVSQAEADALAAARLDELSGAFVQADGLAFRRPDIAAGQRVKLEGLGQRLSGEYLVTSATHVYAPEGLRTLFTVRGARTGLLAEQVAGQEPGKRWNGVVTAVVTNSDDPQKWGRVKVKFPWMADDAESDWARVVSAGAGPEAGFFNMPDVGDEVLVAFEHGEFNRPLVLGGLWNGQHAEPPSVSGAGSGERPLLRTWHSRSGHHITLHDNADKKIELETAAGHKVVLDDANGKIEIVSKGGLTITLDDNSSKLTVESGGQLEVKSSGNMKLQAGGNLDLQATGQVNVKGAMVNLN
ncbi:MAG: VgrG-related protein [Ardenticatenaceae bacterium]|nr:VgrG-related protein [Ardenticatenaceae bacterium]MCB8986349.1 VgrG-related protein [Ardenticatenaceae bacterium]